MHRKMTVWRVLFWLRSFIYSQQGTASCLLLIAWRGLSPHPAQCHVPCFSIIKCVPHEDQAQHSKELVSVSESALICVEEHVINILLRDLTEFWGNAAFFGTLWDIEAPLSTSPVLQFSVSRLVGAESCASCSSHLGSPSTPLHKH